MVEFCDPIKYTELAFLAQQVCFGQCSPIQQLLANKMFNILSFVQFVYFSIVIIWT
jgi:hypothetical protein